MLRAVFLDRDGVITQEPPHYAHRPDQLALIPRSGEAVRLLNENEILVVVVSNQAGIAHGYFREEDTALFNRALGEELGKLGAHIDAFYYCQHHPEAEMEDYRTDCDCRKPGPGMLLKAARDMGIDLPKSFMIGDKLTDIESGKKAGCGTVLVKTGQGMEALKNGSIWCDFIADDLYQAAEYILDLSHNTENRSRASDRQTI